jgi:hypothetical protein
MKKINLYGLRFERLLVINTAKARSEAGAYWLCRCDCGKETIVESGKLRSGHTRSCGCLKAEITQRGPNRTHGLSRGKTYRTWKEMRNRCNNPKATNYKWYGGRGVGVCSRWNNFNLFYSDMGERPPGKTLHRINRDLNYYAANCFWATPKEHAINNRGCFKPGVRTYEKKSGVAGTQ